MSWFQKGPHSGVVSISNGNPNDPKLLSRSDDDRPSPALGLKAQGWVRARCARQDCAFIYPNHEARGPQSGHGLNAEFHAGRTHHIILLLFESRVSMKEEREIRALAERVTSFYNIAPKGRNEEAQNNS